MPSVRTAEDDRGLAAHHRHGVDHRGGGGCGSGGQSVGGAHFASWAGSRKIARTSGGAAMNSTMSDCTTSTMSTGMPCGGLHREPAGLEGAEQDARDEHAPRAGAPEQGHGDRVEADAGVDAGGESGGHGAEHLVDAGEADERTGDQHRLDVHAADVDAGDARGVGVLADGTELEAEVRPVEHPPDDDRGDDRQDEAEVQVVLRRRAGRGRSRSPSSAPTSGCSSPGPAAGPACASIQKTR